MELKHCNCIVVFNKTKDKILFCKRKKDPYKGLYNFVGGKLKKGESSDCAAYRELFEETGISRKDIQLFRLMDLTYYQQEFVLEIYVGMLHKDVSLVEEVNPLEWLALDEDLANSDKYAGDKNIAHIVNMALKFQLEENEARTSRIDRESLCVGVDGCNGGWIAAVIDQGELRIEKYRDIGELTSKYISFDNMLIDMVIGLPSNIEQYERRPDSAARRLIAPRTSTIFAVPSRQAVYENSEAAQIKANKLALGKGLSKQTMALIPKMREVDEFLFKNEKYKNVIKESHPEVCFARLNKAVVMSRKAEFEGLAERVNILSQFLPDLTCQFITDKAKELKCKADDIADAICLAIAANFDLQGKSKAIPQVVSLDDNGLRMQMVIPKL